METGNDNLTNINRIWITSRLNNFPKKDGPIWNGVMWRSWWRRIYHMENYWRRIL